jgi:hypothetical protein
MKESFRLKQLAQKVGSNRELKYGKLFIPYSYFLSHFTNIPVGHSTKNIDKK